MNISIVPRITARFGEIDSVHPRPHMGVDVALPVGTKLFAPVDGVVSRVADYGGNGLGRAVFVKTQTGYQYIMGHLSEIKVRAGEHVSAGELLALSGNTGHSTGPHLHFGLLNSAGVLINPDQLQIQPTNGFLGGIIGKAVASVQHGIEERLRSMTYKVIVGVLEGLRDIVVDLSYSIALLGGGIAIILYVAGWDKGIRWAGILTVAYLLIKYLLG